MILIVQSQWNPQITDSLRTMAESILTDREIPFESIKVPGALEIPLAIKWAWQTAQKNQTALWGAIACGCVIQGETHHFDIVANESSRALMNLSLELRLPIGNAILCVFDETQALARIQRESNKGREACLAVLDMIDLKNKKKYS
ncbi:MAG: 6,7-dimethyl-8-ribityllumazine synthase [Deltaproteobacteria bacterium CG11_big_fil_rev_8_21_14_0_20_45_16]|nr:MAG: 6,7-dimethyl-8-ribityllumazine synthase [Deltaproteobacteria bacterium CG11_big_fil_rev_8_21_14_0_20_45_16]